MQSPNYDQLLRWVFRQSRRDSEEDEESDCLWEEGNAAQSGERTEEIPRNVSMLVA